MNTTINNRFYLIDVAKAICIILVVVGHYTPVNSPKWYMLLHDVIYTFHMPLFMFASGFIYLVTKKNICYKDFIVKKFKRLMVPYFVTSVIIIAIKLLTERHANIENPVSFFSFLEMFWKPEAGYFLWFIWALWWMFVITSLFKTKGQRSIFLIISIILYFLPIDFSELFCLKQVKDYYVWFMLGVCCAEIKPNGGLIKQLAKYPFASLLAFAISIKGVSLGLTDSKIYLFFAALIGICFIVTLSQQIITFNNLNVWVKLSSVSYIIYLFHTTFMGFAKVVIGKLPFDSNLWYVFSFEALIVILIGVAAPMLLYYYLLKRYQITKRLFGL